MNSITEYILDLESLSDDDLTARTAYVYGRAWLDPHRNFKSDLWYERLILCRREWANRSKEEKYLEAQRVAKDRFKEACS